MACEVTLCLTTNYSIYLERKDVNPNAADRVCTVYGWLPVTNQFKNILASLAMPFCIRNHGWLSSAVSCDAVGPLWIAVTCHTFGVLSLHFMIARACALQAHMTRIALMID